MPRQCMIQLSPKDDDCRPSRRVVGARGVRSLTFILKNGNRIGLRPVNSVIIVVSATPVSDLFVFSPTKSEFVGKNVDQLLSSRSTMNHFLEYFKGE